MSQRTQKPSNVSRDDDDAAWWVSVPEADGPAPTTAPLLLLPNGSRTQRVIGFRGGLVEVRPAVKVT